MLRITEQGCRGYTDWEAVGRLQGRLEAFSNDNRRNDIRVKGQRPVGRSGSGTKAVMDQD